jgi:cobalamin biosynthesis protein CobW
VQGVGTRFRHHFDRAWKPNEARSSRLVVIGEKGIDREAITEALGHGAA